MTRNSTSATPPPLRLLRRAALLAGAGALLTTGVAQAAPAAPPAPIHLPDTRTEVRTPDGWTIDIALTGVTVTPVPNLASTPFSREAFWSGTATGHITGKGSDNVDSAQIKLQLQTGCQVDVSSGAQLSADVTPTIGVNPSVSVNWASPVGVSTTNSPSASLSGTGSAQTTLKPGVIATQDVATRKFKGPVAWTALDHVETKIDACAGPVTIRLAAGTSISTEQGDETIFTYSRPSWI